MNKVAILEKQININIYVEIKFADKKSTTI